MGKTGIVAFIIFCFIAIFASKKQKITFKLSWRIKDSKYPAATASFFQSGNPMKSAFLLYAIQSCKGQNGAQANKQGYEQQHEETKQNEEIVFGIMVGIFLDLVYCAVLAFLDKQKKSTD